MIAEPVDVVPAQPAPPIPSYPQFEETCIPRGSGASRAFRGFVRPFSDDQTARRVLRALNGEHPMFVYGGRLDAKDEGLPVHPMEPYLTGMAQPCTVVVLEFASEEHPRAYLVDPPIEKRLSSNAHLRWDLCATIDGRSMPALCIYSGNLFKYDPSLERLPQFLNQLSTYLAKHLIFLRTRMLCTVGKDGKVHSRRKRQPDEPVKPRVLGLVKNLAWFGYWPGRAAPQGPEEHLRTVGPNDECWCNSGRPYKDCHRPREYKYVNGPNPFDFLRR